MKFFKVICLVNIMVFLLVGCSSVSSNNRSVIKQYEVVMEAYKSGRFSDAEPMLRKLLRDYPTFSEGWYRLGNLYVRTGENEAALMAFKQCLHYDSRNAKAWHNMALVNVKIAVATLDEGIEQFEPNSPDYNRLVGLKLSMLSIGAEQSKVLDPTLNSDLSQ